MKDSSVRRWSAFHARIYRLTGGAIGRRLVGNDMMLLTTTGRVTGRRHTVPLLYLKDGANLIVIASYGGRSHHPSWYDNLVAEPSVEVQVRDERMQMVARTAIPEERALWWPRIVAGYEGYLSYQERTDREIPVVVLRPVQQPQDQTR